MIRQGKGAVTRRMHADRVAGLYGSLAHLSKGAIEQAVGRLLAEGVIVSEVRDDFAPLPTMRDVVPSIPRKRGLCMRPMVPHRTERYDARRRDWT